MTLKWWMFSGAVSAIALAMLALWIQFRAVRSTRSLLMLLAVPATMGIVPLLLTICPGPLKVTTYFGVGLVMMIVAGVLDLLVFFEIYDAAPVAEKLTLTGWGYRHPWAVLVLEMSACAITGSWPMIPAIVEEARFSAQQVRVTQNGDYCEARVPIKAAKHIVLKGCDHWEVTIASPPAPFPEKLVFPLCNDEAAWNIASRFHNFVFDWPLPSRTELADVRVRVLGEGSYKLVKFDKVYP